MSPLSLVHAALAQRNAPRASTMSAAALGLCLAFGAGCGSSDSPGIEVRSLATGDNLFHQELDRDQCHVAVGDVTNDGKLDIVVVGGRDALKDGAARIGVFQQVGDGWDDGADLAGSLWSNNSFPVIGPAHNDGQNLLVYGEHRWGNTNGRIRSHLYGGTHLVDSFDVTDSLGWPFSGAPTLADLEDDGELDVWSVYVHGAFPDPDPRLLKHTWNPTTGTFDGGEVHKAPPSGFHPRQPIAADFLGNGKVQLAWQSGSAQLDIVSANKGAYPTQTIFSVTRGGFIDFAAGEVDGSPGVDIVALVQSVTALREVYLISGQTFQSTALLLDQADRFVGVQIADLDGDGRGEIYLSSRDGGLFHLSAAGLEPLLVDASIVWGRGTTARLPGRSRDSVIFVGSTDPTSIIVVAIESR